MVNEKQLIDAKSLMDRLRKRREDFASGWRTFDSMPDVAKAKYEENLACSLIIEDFPTVEAVEVVHGRWVRKEIRGLLWSSILPHCSECNALRVQDEANYCPNCGARMDGGAGD